MKGKIICLGLESTAHTFGASVITYSADSSEPARVLSNIKETFTTEEGGMLPAEVADFHVNNSSSIINEALSKAGLSIKGINLISYSESPGIGHTLRIGCMVAKTIATLHEIALVGVNHCIAHLEIGQMLFDCKDPVLLYASGANTQVIAYKEGKYRIFGETLDIGIGNLLDSIAREFELGFPGGPKLQELAKRSENYVKLPYSVKGMDVSFGGLLTNIKQKLKKGYTKEELAFSIQETVFAMLIEVSERALAHTGKTELLLGGGVACNTRLKDMATKMCKSRGAKIFIPENQFLVDNAAMIAWLGILRFISEKDPTQKPTNATIYPYIRTDEVKVTWK